MAIQVGDRIPAATLKVPTADGIQDRSTEQIFGGKKVVLFAVPGAFTPTCSMKHLPGFVQQAAAIRAKGVDTIVCMAVNDAFVMAADGNGEFAKALGLDFDGSKFGMGRRAQRFALIAENGVVTHLAVEAPGRFEVSSAEAVLQAL
jgi:peroxiredoxin